MKLKTRNLLLGAAATGCMMLLGACVGDGGYAEVDADYYGPVYGGPIFYGHPSYRGDSHIAGPPRQDWHGGGRPSAPARENRAAPAKRSVPTRSDRDRK